jgi:hypothetical protein
MRVPNDTRRHVFSLHIFVLRSILLLLGAEPATKSIGSDEGRIQLRVLVLMLIDYLDGHKSFSLNICLHVTCASDPWAI